MNLWRVAIDEANGQPIGVPEPVTTGVQATAGLPRLSKDGTRLAFRSRIASINPVAIPFDPVTLKAGVPFLLDTRNNIRVPSDVSPDGKQIAFFSIGEQQEDMFIGTADGPMRRVTDDGARDRAPVFTPDGKSLIFYSAREGRWGAWMVGVDGGNLRKLMAPESGVVYVNLSPSGDSLAYSGDSGRTGFIAPLAGSAPPTQLALEVNGAFLNATAWSPDGKRLAGQLAAASGRPAGVGIYDLSGKIPSLIGTDETYAVKWLPDSRRVIYFTKGGSELVVLDADTGKRVVVDVRLSGPSTNDMFAISRDGRMIYYGAVRSEADIWIVEQSKP